MNVFANRTRMTLWPLLAVSAASWCALIGSQSHVHGVPTRSDFGSATSETSISSQLVVWLVMLGAMMAPLLAVPIRRVWDWSRGPRAVTAVGIFVLGYAFPWIGGLALLEWMASRLRELANSELVSLLIAVGVALVWQGSAAKAQCLVRCQSLSAFREPGSAPEIASLQFGLATSVWCMGACGALMLIPAVAHRTHVVSMAVVTLVALRERLAQRRRLSTDTRLVGSGMAVLAAGVLEGLP